MRVKAAERGFSTAHDNYRWMYKKRERRKRESVGIKARRHNGSERGKERLDACALRVACEGMRMHSRMLTRLSHSRAPTVSLTQSWYLPVMSPLGF